MTTSPDSPANFRDTLSDLAAALNPQDFITTLAGGQPLRLSVVSRHARQLSDIYTEHGSYWWSWAERIAPVGDPPAAARKIAAVLRVTPTGETAAPTGNSAA